MEDKVNTTIRHDSYCRKVSKDGRVCGLYSLHPGGHLDLRQGANKDRWGDGDE